MIEDYQHEIEKISHLDSHIKVTAILIHLKAMAEWMTGQMVEEAMKQFPLVFPATITEITHVGEETGKLDTTLAELAEFYEEDLEQIMHNLPSVLEPVLMLLLGVSVGGMAVAIIMPMYSLSSQL